ncbi:hypothetical protein PoB_001159100 [Plakobranchus ocellatus]|uniref:Uncharacterized protein n=1 Tax=Plakobranchus ocellatus TaxID=259542 RepID=A0AAV3YCM0_9GAST|nr:hypothetical protein PoB_001159100 [Plakobranchus ocellatus]
MPGDLRRGSEDLVIDSFPLALSLMSYIFSTLRDKAGTLLSILGANLVNFQYTIISSRLFKQAIMLSSRFFNSGWSDFASPPLPDGVTFLLS